jgi:hypothetical protein
MNDEELDNLWRRRAEADADDGASADFADRVMEAVRREPLPSSSSSAPAKGVLGRLLSSPAVRVAACVLAGVACLCRMAAVVAVFFVP